MNWLGFSKGGALFVGMLLAAGGAVVQGQTMLGESSYAETSDVTGTFVGADYDSNAPVTSSTDVLYAQEADAAEETPSDDPLVNLQRQLDKLEAQTAAMKADFDAEKKKNARNDKPNAPFTVKVGGQIRFDGNYISQNDEAKANYGNVSNSIGVNDIRIQFGGTGYTNLQYNLIVKLNSGISFQDAWIRVKNTRIGDITVGNQFVESGMESIETNADRAFPSIDESTTFFALRRKVGVTSRIFGDDKRTRLMLGLFVPQNCTSSPHRVNLDNTGVVLNTRLSALPIFVEDEDGFTREVMHVGGSYYWLDPSSNQSLTLATAGEGWYSGNPKFLQGTIPLGGNSYSVSNLDLAYQYEGLGISGEGYVMSIDDAGNAYGTSLSARWILTPGCTRIYKRDEARFGTIKMAPDALFLDYKNRTVGNNFGAWELLTKWEWTEANNLKNLSNATYGSVNRLVAAMNWFWNEQTSWTLGWEHAFVDSMKSSGASAKGDFDTLLLEAYFKF